MITHTTEHGRASGNDHRSIPAGSPCFYCHNRLNGTVVMWWGSSGDIYLHPECTVELAIRLLRDVHQIEHATHSHVTGDTGSLLSAHAGAA